MSLRQAAVELNAARAEWADATRRLSLAVQGEAVPLEVKQALIEHLDKGAAWMAAIDAFIAAGGG